MNPTGFFDGQHWRMLPTQPVLPNGRYHHAMAYDSVRHATVMFGGETANWVFSGETWELIAVDDPLINEQPASKLQAIGGSAVFSLTAVGPGALSYRWFHDGRRLDDDSRISGTTTSTLTIADVRSADVGAYSALVLNACGVTESQFATLTLGPTLRIFRIGNNGVNVLWNPPESILQQADDPQGPWTDVLNATTPYDAAPLHSKRFFRLRP